MLIEGASFEDSRWKRRSPPAQVLLGGDDAATGLP